MNAFGSECSSGCESGWTLYLEHSFLNQNVSHKEEKLKDENSVEEDLSMVSDASSGPPHHFPYFHEQELNACFYSPSKEVKRGKMKKRAKVNQQYHEDQQHLPSFLHDTASSHVFGFSNTNFQNNDTGTNQQSSIGSMLDYSQGFSTNYFEGTSSFQEQHFGFLQQSISENEHQGNKWYGEKGMGIR